MLRKTLHIATLGLPDEQLRALISASGLLQSRLPAQLAWDGTPASADIIIIDTRYAPGDGVSLAPQAVLLSHTPEGDASDDCIARPLRMPQLERCLQKAVQAVLDLSAPPAPDPAPKRQTSSGQRIYRGQVIGR